MFLGLCSCKVVENIQYEYVFSTEEVEENLPIEFIYISSDGTIDFYYDRDTKVIYAITHQGTNYGHGYAMTPLYNADGTLRTYTDN